MKLPPALENRFHEFLCCLAFYTRLPLGRFFAKDSDFTSAQWAAPAAGIVIGLCAGAVFAVAYAAGVPSEVAAAICLAVVILLTGALHEDGAADMADGFGGGRTVERKLEIMRDSRLGTFGALTLVMTVLLRWSALAAMSDPVDAALALVAAHAASRSAIPVFLMNVPAARTDGLGAGVGPIDRQSAGLALLIGAAALMLAGVSAAILAAAALVVWYFALRALCIRQIGGQTGDVVGALQQGGEIIVLVAAVSW